MEIEAIVTIAIVILAFIMFATEYFSVDHVAITIMVLLALFGVLEPSEAVKGFANEATITVAAMYVLSDALIKTGLIERLGPFFLRLLNKSYLATLFTMITGTGIVSAFINNTPVVATLIPLIKDAANKNNQPASKLLIPLSYGAMIGGCCTLIGTSTNLLLNGILTDSGAESLGLFDMAPLGLVFFAFGTIYLLLFANKLLPSNPNSLVQKDFNVKTYLTEVLVISQQQEDNEPQENEAPLFINDLFKQDGLEVKVTRVKRKDNVFNNPEGDFKLEQGDILLILGEHQKIRKILKNQSILISENLGSRSFENEKTRLVEIILLPNSNLTGKKLDNLDFLHRYRANVLAIRQRGKERLNDLKNVRLKEGDILMLQTNELGFAMLKAAQRAQPAPFISLSERTYDSANDWKLFASVLLIATMITLVVFNVISLMIGAIAATSILIFARITSMESAYEAIDWRIIILLAGALSLGTAMDKSGVSELVATFMISTVGEALGPIAVVSALYLLTSLLTEIMSNNAAAALLAPIALSIAASFEVAVTPFIMAIAFAASASFMTPIGYQTNTMVYGAGNYAFKDFLRIGTPLNILFWIIATLLIPFFYPF